MLRMCFYSTQSIQSTSAIGTLNPQTIIHRIHHKIGYNSLQPPKQAPNITTIYAYFNSDGPTSSQLIHAELYRFILRSIIVCLLSR